MSIERNTDPTMDLLNAVDLADDIGCTAVKLETLIATINNYFDGPCNKKAVQGIGLSYEHIQILLECVNDYLDVLKKTQGTLAQTLDLLR